MASDMKSEGKPSLPLSITYSVITQQQSLLLNAVP